MTSLQETQPSQSGYPNLSSRLQEAFGFKKKAPWAAILKVQRKTLYDWESAPDTQVSSKITKRLDTLKALHDEMVPEHRSWLHSFTYGKHSDRLMAEALVADEITFDTLVQQYGRLLVKIDGAAKRAQLQYWLDKQCLMWYIDDSECA